MGTELEYIHMEDVKDEMKRIQRTEPDPTKGRRTQKGGENFNRTPCPSCQERQQKEKGESSSKAGNEEDAAETEVKTRVASRPEVGTTFVADAPGNSNHYLVADGVLPFAADKKKGQIRPRTPRMREDDSVSITVESEEERDLIRPDENQDNMAETMANIEIGTQEPEKTRKKSPRGIGL